MIILDYESHLPRQKELDNYLNKALNGETLDYPSICNIKEQGMYIIFDKLQILYVGKTTRTGKIRMQELAADFRSHTFNRKLLGHRFREHGYTFTALKNETKNHWIQEGTITEIDFKEHQKFINEFIRAELSFKFLPIPDTKWLTSMEHYAIAVLNPVHND